MFCSYVICDFCAVIYVKFVQKIRAKKNNTKESILWDFTVK